MFSLRTSWKIARLQDSLASAPKQAKGGLSWAQCSATTESVLGQEVGRGLVQHVDEEER